ncbi:MAG: DUF3168 domain-containing protein [Firmicutes bacterium]|nr:DUF3168 domain-containing protein [Bacillota bacterium]MBE3590826.1 DUF3168 domain-containing protein [Bacillota bacterium]
MSVEADLRSCLVAYAPLAALVSSRIYPLALPESPTLPAISYQRISRRNERTMGSPVAVQVARFQLDCWAQSYGQAKDVAAQVMAALDGRSGAMGGTTILDAHVVSELDLYEPDTKLYRVTVDVEVAY